MPTKTSKPDTSTIVELLLREWSDHYPKEKVSALFAKANSLSYTITELDEKITSLTIAKSRLEDLSVPLSRVVSDLSTAISKRDDFIGEYGDLGMSMPIPQDEMKATLSMYTDTLTAYSKSVHDAYFANLEQIKTIRKNLGSLKDFYGALATIITTIRESFFKVEESRRKPIIRDLYRHFKSLADNFDFDNLNPSMPNPLLHTTIDKEEFNGLFHVRKNAKKAAQILKTCR